MGGTLRDLVDVTVFVSDINDYTAAAAAQVRDESVGHDGLPASALVEVDGFLLPQMRVLIKGTAVVGSVVG